MTKSLFTIGDSMIVMNPVNTGPLRFNHTFERTLGIIESPIVNKLFVINVTCFCIF